MNKYRIYEMNDCDWWMATSAEEAKRDYLASIDGDESCIDDSGPRQLTNEQLDKLKFSDDLPETEDNTRTFREEMARREPRSQFFASTEY